MKKKTINFIIFLIILILFFIYTKNTYVFITINIYIYLYTYFLIKDYILKREEEKYIEEKFQVVKTNLLNIEEIIILILKDNKIVWANDNAYIKFPHLKSKRSPSFLYDNTEDEILKFNNKIYKILETGDVYVMIEYTDTYRKQRKLNNIQTIIGYFQIDNLAVLKNTMEEREYLNFITDFEKKLYDIFIKNKISFQKISQDSYYLNFPYEYIKTSLENRFKDIGELIREYHEIDIVVTTSMGIAYSFYDVDETGRKAREAFELAISRGGGQIVVFEENKKYYFGGGVSSSKGTHRFRARIIGNTLARILPTKEVIYLITHANPDSDGLAAILLFYEYLKRYNDLEVKVLIDSEKSAKQFKLDKYEMYKDVIYDYVIDKTKKNLLIALDTQSKEILSHPSILEEIPEIIIIDHHQTPSKYFRGNIFSWIEPNASSTTELIMSIIITSNTTIISNEINTFAIIGILTDTNRLKYRTSYQTLDALMHLMESGGNLDKALSYMYLKREEFIEKQKILADAEYINIFSYVEVDREVDNFLISNIADELLQIQGVEGSVAICRLTEEEELYRVKLRTTDKMNAKNLIEPFGGGGHFKQAAAVMNKEQKLSFLEHIKSIKF